MHYGEIYDDGVSATEYEYNTFTANKHDAYFSLKTAKQEMKAVQNS